MAQDPILCEIENEKRRFSITKKSYLILKKAIYFFLIEKSRSKNSVFRFRSAFSISHKIGPYAVKKMISENGFSDLGPK